MLSVIAGAQRFAHANQFRDGKVGEVTRIGIRASVIRTANGSEVIVPNGSLISSQVTNWTSRIASARSNSPSTSLEAPIPNAWLNC